MLGLGASAGLEDGGKAESARSEDLPKDQVIEVLLRHHVILLSRSIFCSRR